MTTAADLRDQIREQVRFRPNSSDDKWVIPEIIKVDMYRFSELARILEYDQGYVLDCGAHIGAFTLMAVHFLPWLEVRAYEPQPDNFALLMQNTDAYSQVKRFNAAVALNDGKISLYNRTGETGDWTCIAMPNKASEEVAAVRFANLIEAGCQLLKLDLEGYEACLLNTLPEDCLAIPKVLVLEEHGYPVDYERLTRAGFEILFRPYNSPRHSVWRRH